MVGLFLASAATQREMFDWAGHPSRSAHSAPDGNLVTDAPSLAQRSGENQDAAQGELVTANVPAEPSAKTGTDQQRIAPGPAALEQVLVTAVRRRVRAARAASSSELAEPLGSLIDQLVENPAADLSEACEQLMPQRGRWEQELAALVAQSHGHTRLAAVRLLARIATPRSLPLLLQVRQWPPARRDATAAVARLANPLTLARLAQAEPWPDLQQRLLSALLQQGNDQAVYLFLQFVRQPATCEVALKAVPDVSRPPLDILFAYLQGPQVRTRIAAARVLGQVDDPQVSRRLIHLVFHGQASREALVALAASHEASAAEFVAQARRDLALAASMRAARQRAASLPN
jgi:hypothetical protein